MFDLQFIPQHNWPDKRNEHVIRGQITIGEFSEVFESSLSYWSQTEYEQQWLAAAKRIKDGQSTSAFIVNMYDPNQATFIVWWPIWHIGKTVFVQNHLLFLDRLIGGFDSTNPYVHIKERATESEDGETI